jgi:chromosome partitioning protein
MPFNPNLVCLTFINKADARGNYKEETADLLRESTAVKFIDNPIGNRISFANAAASGLGVIEIKPVDEKAVAEVTDLYNGIQNAMKISTKKKKSTT